MDGGVSTNHLRSVPLGVPMLLLGLCAIPRAFPYHPSVAREATGRGRQAFQASMARIDFLGALLLLVATVTLTAAFEEAESRFPWRSAYVITLLTVSGISWLLLLVWERHVTLGPSEREPVLPWRFFQDRRILGLLMYAQDPPCSFDRF
jgi:hypothetical protein